MGSTPSKVYTGDKKKLVIVGASFGGNTIAKALIGLDPQESMYDIILVDKSEHFEFICSYYKIWSEDVFKDLAIKYEDQMASYNTKRISYKQGKLTEVLHDPKEIKIETKDGTIETVSYDALCLITGASVMTPWKGDDDTIYTMEQREAEVKECYEKVKASLNILVVGAGATGVETACYLKQTYPEKTVSICQRGAKFLPQLGDSAHPLVVEGLKTAGVEALPETPYNEELAAKYDYVIDCRGFKFLGPRKYMTGPLAECLDKKTGQIFINNKGQVTNKHPLIEKGQPSTPTVYDSIFSFGDVCLTSMNEVKSIVSMYQYGHVVANNIKEVAIGGSSFAQLPSETHILQMVNFGKTGGVFAFNKMVAAKPDAYAEKEKMKNDTMGANRGIKKHIEGSAKVAKDMPKIFGLASGCCSCLPMHISKKRGDNMLELANAKKEYEKHY